MKNSSKINLLVPMKKAKRKYTKKNFFKFDAKRLKRRKFRMHVLYIICHLRSKKFLLQTIFNIFRLRSSNFSHECGDLVDTFGSNDGV